MEADRRKLVFDSVAWCDAGGDVGDNSQFWKPAALIDVQRDVFRDQDIATVRFDDGRVSHGHIVAAMCEVPS